MIRVLFLIFGVPLLVAAQTAVPDQAAAATDQANKTPNQANATPNQTQAAADQAQASVQAPPVGKLFLVDTGTHIPLSLINSVSTKNAVAGDRVYLETVFPVLVDGRIVIPPGSYVAGTITEIKRPGRVKGRGEFHLRFESLTLPNGATRDFRAHVTGLDGRASEELDHKEGTIRSEGNKSGDVRTVGETAAAGASIGALAGSISGAPGMGAAIGAGAGAAVALGVVMFTRGPDAVLAKGTTIEMILDRQVRFAEDELDFTNALPRRSTASDGGGPLPSKHNQPPPYSRFPL